MSCRYCNKIRCLLQADNDIAAGTTSYRTKLYAYITFDDKTRVDFKNNITRWVSLSVISL
ncbi:CLUMA_CG008824, isoform A [Clunio marinus]|uniref:CLUMA_CG008824, isoform A n=1 Tax=Clunio marinus TaxID=568069 RepID=A0A1J1I6L9_9DIPT|nr:CLUMA_CG008824, isoform A [Clunio marinus]